MVHAKLNPESFAANLSSSPKHDDLCILFDLLSKTESVRAKGQAFGAGAFVHGGLCGLRGTVHEFPKSVQAFCNWVKSCDPKFCFSSIYVHDGPTAPPHVDAHNQLGSLNLLARLSDFSGGEVWAEGRGSEIKHINGRDVVGGVLPWTRPHVTFNPRLTHFVLPAKGRRVVLAAFTIRNLEKLSSQSLQHLRQLGFNLPTS